MTNLLKEITIQYSPKLKTLHWDYFAMYLLWAKIGSEGLNRARADSEIPSGRRQELIDDVYEQIAHAFAEKLIRASETYNYDSYQNKESIQIIKRLKHYKNTNNLLEMHGAIVDVLKLFQANTWNVFDPGNENIGFFPQIISDLLYTKNPSIFIGDTSPIISKIIKSNLHFFVSRDKVDVEKSRKTLINKPAIAFTDEEIRILTQAGMDIIENGFAKLNYEPPKTILKKIAPDTFIIKPSEESDGINIEYSLNDAYKYIQTLNRQRHRTPGWGYNLIVPTEAPKEVPDDIPMTFPKRPEKVPDPTGKVPHRFRNLPPLDTSMTGNTSKRVGAGIESVFKNYGYEWSDIHNGYENPVRNVLIQIKQDNSANVTLRTIGREITYPNLGALLRKLAHNKKKRHSVTENTTISRHSKKYKDIYKLLYK